MAVPDSQRGPLRHSSATDELAQRVAPLRDSAPRTNPGPGPPFAPGTEPDPDYYLKHFQQLLQFAQLHCTQLLSAELCAYIESCLGLPERAQRLYARLVTRRGPWFRSDRLDYAEIGELETAAAALHAAGLLSIDEAAGPSELLDLLKVDELRGLATALGGRATRKAALIVHIAGAVPPSWLRLHLQQRFRWYRVRGRRWLDQCALLFFGNSGQHLQTFVIAELGHVRYEHVAAVEYRPFADRNQFAAHLEYLRLRAALHRALGNGHIAAAIALANDLLTAVLRPEHEAWRAGALLQLSRFFERDDAVLLALRTADASDNEDGQRRARLLRKRHKLPTPDHAPTRIRTRFEPAVQIFPSRSAPQAVEAWVLAQLAARGYQGKHWENAFPCAVFGLLFWDIVFAAVPGAFGSPFQQGPLDLRGGRFRARRSVPIEQRLAAIAADRVPWRDQLLATFRVKQGIANPFVAWDALDVEHLRLAVHALPAPLAAAICDRISADPVQMRRGFPDLTLIAPDGTLQFCEVKSANDQLQRHQRRWLAFLAEHAAEAFVAKVP